MILAYFLAFVAAVILSSVLTRGMRNLANRRRWVATPENNRHVHQRPVPRLGGVAIYAAFTIVTGTFVALSGRLPIATGMPSQTLSAILIAGTPVFLLGLCDDARSVRPITKLIIQSLAAIALYHQGFRVLQIPLFGSEYEVGWFALPITILWILLITNAFNLIDGLDGLAAGSAVFSTFTVFIVSVMNGNLMVALLTATLAGAIAGFLPFNFNPASIFLGDCGSLLIGFTLSACALAGSQKSSTVVAVAIPVMSFGLPILETIISIFRRFLSGQPLFGADREHIHHKLLERGLTQRQAVILLYGVSAVCGMLSLFLLNLYGGAAGIVLFVSCVGVWVGLQRLGYQEFSELGRVVQRAIEQKRIIANNLAVRKAMFELEGAQSYAKIYEILKRIFEYNEFDGFCLSFFSKVTGKAQLGWKRGGGRCDGQAGWKLTLDLVAGDGDEVGLLTVHRSCSDKPCLVDLNLLTSAFRIALAGAIRRAVEAEEHSEEKTSEIKAVKLTAAVTHQI